MSGHDMDDERPAQTPDRCRAIKKSGVPCSARAVRQGYCFGHAPDLEEKRQEARRRGGSSTSRAARAGKLLPIRLRPVADALESAIGEVHRGELDPRNAQAMASLAGALVKVMTSGELEERMRALEAKQNGGP